MWALPAWVGTYLSPGNKGHELAEYARRCNAVEGNTTFYALPSERTIARWTELAPDDFRFAFKLPKAITHERRLADAGGLVASFLDRLEPLGERIGPVQIQLPPSFGPESAPVLTSFVSTLSSEVRWVIELRHPRFFDSGPAHRAVDEVLADAGVGRVVLDTRPLYSATPRSDAALEERRTKPRLAIHREFVGDAPVIRVIGEDGVDGTLSGLRAWIPQLVEWIKEGREPYLFVHQPENLHSPDLARIIHSEVAAEIDRLDPLPDPLPVAPRSEITGQDSLF